MYVFPFVLFNKVKLITHSHNGNGKNKFINAIFKPLVNLCTDKYLACSEVACDWLFGKSKRKECTIINNGIDTDRFKYNEEIRKNVQKKLGLQNNKIIGHVGRFSTQKNHEFLIKIFEKIYEKDNSFRLVLIGVGEEETKIKNIVKNKKLEKIVFFLGKKDNTQDFYSAFDYFLMPSLYEGLPVVGIEAQCSGLQCFFSNTIDKQILISDRAKMIDLNSSENLWANSILETKIDNTNRTKYATEINEKGYGIKSTISLLEKIYEVNIYEK